MNRFEKRREKCLLFYLPNMGGGVPLLTANVEKILIRCYWCRNVSTWRRVWIEKHEFVTREGGEYEYVEGALIATRIACFNYFRRDVIYSWVNLPAHCLRNTARVRGGPWHSTGDQKQSDVFATLILLSDTVTGHHWRMVLRSYLIRREKAKAWATSYSKWMCKFIFFAGPKDT